MPTPFEKGLMEFLSGKQNTQNKKQAPSPLAGLTSGQMGGVAESSTQFSQETVDKPSITPWGIPKVVVQGTAQSGAKTALLIRDSMAGRTTPSSLKLDKDATPFERGLMSFLFGAEEVTGIAQDIADIELAVEPLVGQRAARGFTTPIVLGLTALDFTTGGGKLGVIESLLKAKTASKASTILKNLGVAEDVIQVYAPKFAQATDRRVVEEGLNSLERIAKNTKKATATTVADTLLTEARKYKSAEEFAGARGEPVTLYHGSNKALTKDRLDYGTFLTANKQEAIDYANMRSGGRGGKPVISEFALTPNEVRLNSGTGEYQYIGKTKNLAGGKYPETIYKALNDAEGSNLTRKEIDAIPLDELRTRTSMGLEGGRDEFNQLVEPTKSQLTDIWKKAQDLPELPKIPRGTRVDLGNTDLGATYKPTAGTKQEYRALEAKQDLLMYKRRVQAKAATKIESINTAKDVLDNRRGFVRAVQKQFGLSDADMKKVSQRDIRLMTNLEFKQHLDNLRVRAEKLASRKQARAELETTIQTKELQKVENLQKAMKLPTIENMTEQQLRDFNDTLSAYKQGDEFLSVRKIETIDKTDISGVRTIREAKERLAQELGVDVSKLDNIKVDHLDRYRYDTALAERNPFYALMVDSVNKAVLGAEARFIGVEDRINELINAARKSRTRSVVDRFVPQDKEIFKYLESDDAAKKALDLTPEELRAALYIQGKYAEMRDYLVQFGALKKYRENYITHIQRGFLEGWKEDGLLSAIKNVFKQYQKEEAVFNIISDTGQVLPLEKFFQFSMRRTGELKPTQNVAKAFLSYLKAFEKKQALDSIVPKLDIYAHSLTPRTMTPRGLEFDRSLKTFVNEWINTKKGRTAKIVGVEQGGKIDLLLRAGKAFTAMLDLGLNIPVGIGARAGENITNFIQMGTKNYANGILRARTAQGKNIAEKYKNFIGRTPFDEIADASRGIGEKLFDGLFGLFRDASVRSNKTFLLGSLSDEEFKSGVVSAQRLAELRREMGRYRVVAGAKSVVGSTSVGGALTQYKTWAIPPLRSTISNLEYLARTRNIDSKEGQEILRATLSTLAVVFLVKSFIGDEEDDSFLGAVLNKAYRDAMTLVGALDPKTITSEPRLVSFIADLGEALNQIVTLEGVDKAQKALTPRAAEQLIPSGESSSSGFPDIPDLPELPSLPSLPELPKFP